MASEKKIPFGFGLPQVSLAEPVNIEPIGRVARRAEALGFDSLWTLDQVLGGSRNLEPISLLSYVAAITTRVRLGTAVFVLPQHNPVQLAKELATLDVLSGGRVDAGFGIGNDDQAQSAAFGLRPGRRVRRFTESLAVMRALWSERKATFHGDFFDLDDIRMEPKPVQRPGPPVWFGGRVEPALRRAVRLGDAWMGPGSSSIDDFRGHVATCARRSTRRVAIQTASPSRSGSTWPSTMTGSGPRGGCGSGSGMSTGTQTSPARSRSGGRRRTSTSASRSSSTSERSTCW